MWLLSKSGAARDAYHVTPWPPTLVAQKSLGGYLLWLAMGRGVDVTYNDHGTVRTGFLVHDSVTSIQ